MQNVHHIKFITSPNVECVIHGNDGSPKQVTNLPIYETYLKVLLHHFQLKGKNTYLLNEALSNLLMEKRYSS